MRARRSLARYVALLAALLATILSACAGQDPLDPWDSKGNLRSLTRLPPGAKGDLTKVATGAFQVRTEVTLGDCQMRNTAAASPSKQEFVV